MARVAKKPARMAQRKARASRHPSHPGGHAARVFSRDGAPTGTRVEMDLGTKPELPCWAGSPTEDGNARFSSAWEV